MKRDARGLPALPADQPKGFDKVKWAAPSAILARWSPEIRAAEADDDATISIYDEIGEGWFGDGWTVKRVAAALRRIGDRAVTVNINSPGGDLFEGFAIYNTLREHPQRVTVNVVGIAASAASAIAMAGDSVRVAEAGFLMIHNAWGLVIGNRHDLMKIARDLESFDGALAGLYARRSGMGESEIAGLMDDETWFNGRQAIDAGLADQLLDSDEVERVESPEAKALRAERVIERALQETSHSRKDARRLLSELKSGKPGAAADATRDAGDEELAGYAAGLIDTMRAF